MSSYKPVDYGNSTPIENSEQRQQPSTAPRQQFRYQNQYLQQPRQQQPPPSSSQQPEQHRQQRQEMFEMQHNTSFAPSSRMLTRIDVEEELEVIGSFEPRSKQRLPMRLPNLNYKYPKAEPQNFSPGTSLIFNAYRRHSELLTQPYMAVENADGGTYDESYQRNRKSLTQEAYGEEQHHYQPHESSSYSPHRQQKSLEHQPYRSPHESPFHPYHANDRPSESRDYKDHHESREYRDPREHENPGTRPGQRSSGMTMSGSMESRIEQSRDSRGRIPEQHYDRPPDYPPQPSTQPPSQQHVPPDGHPIPQQHWKRSDSDHGLPSHSYDGSGSNVQFQPPQSQSQSQPQQRQQMDPPHSNPIAIPHSRNRGSVNYSAEYDHRGSMDHSMRGQHSSYSQHSQHSQQPAANGPMGSSGYPPFGPRAMGPRYSLNRLNYRMIFEYASEIRECLIKGKVGSTDRLLYNAEILGKIFMGCRSDVDPNAPIEEDTAVNPHQLRCTSCYIVKTPEWRKGPLGPRTLCNACGLIWGKMSRNKAAMAGKKLEPAPKTEPGATGDAQMFDATPDSRRGSGPGLSQSSISSISLDGSRKRGRDLSSMLDEDDAEYSARDDDRRLADLSISDDQSADKDMEYEHSSLLSLRAHPGALSNEDSKQDYANIERSDVDRDSRPLSEEASMNGATGPVPHAHDSPAEGEREGQDKKLSLSYVLG